MANNNSTKSNVPPECLFSLEYWQAAESAQYVGYEILTPIYTIVALPGFAFALTVMVKQNRLEKAYLYQMFLMASKTVEAVALTLFFYAFNWGGVETAGLPWYKRSYFCMWYTAHISIASTQVTMNTSMFIALSMSIDRLFALMKPLVYKNIDRRRHQYVALAVSVVIGFASSIHNSFLFMVVTTDDDGYQVVTDELFAESRLGGVMTIVSCFVRIFGLTSLVTCNGLLIRAFRMRSGKLASMAVVSTDSQKQAKQKKVEGTLIMLTVMQSTLCSLTMLEESVFYLAAYTVQYFYCYGRLLGPVLNMNLAILSMADVVGPFLISGRMRASAKHLLQGKSATVATNLSSSVAKRQD